MPSQPPLLEIKRKDDVTVVRFTHWELMDEEVIEFVGRELVKLIADPHCRQLVLDFSAVKRMATHMLGELIILHKKVQTAGGSLALCGLNPDLRDVFEVTRLTVIFPIFDDEEEACQNVS
jgi:anti-sigma B factor antagonist